MGNDNGTFVDVVQVVEVVRPMDKQKDNEPKTFCFVTFAREEVARNLVKQVN